MHTNEVKGLRIAYRCGDMGSVAENFTEKGPPGWLSGPLPALRAADTEVNTCLIQLSCTGDLHIVNNSHNICIQRGSLRFFAISSLRHELFPTRTLKWPGHNCVKIMCNTLSTYHVQRVVCHLIGRDSSAITLVAPLPAVW